MTHLRLANQRGARRGGEHTNGHPPHWLLRRGVVVLHARPAQRFRDDGDADTGRDVLVVHLVV